MDISYSQLAIWVIVFLILVVIEILTINIVTAWFVAGSVASIFSVFLTKNLNIQISVFVIFSAIAMLVLKNFLEKISNFKKTNTNFTVIIGKKCLVTKEIGGLSGNGEIIIDGNLWLATSNNPSEVIPVGSEVKIISISGVKVVVEKI